MTHDRQIDALAGELTDARRFTVGELAKLVGVSVRTLQYYDQNRLLPATFSEGGRRVYGREAVFKLQQLLFLKELGFSLKEIRSIIQQGDATDFKRIFTDQRDIMLRKIENLQQIVGTLNKVIAETRNGSAVSLEKLIVILELMREGNPYTFVVRYFKDDQLQQLMNRFTSSPQAGEFTDKASTLFQQLHQLYREHVDPAGAAGQAFAEAWWEMVTEFTGGSEELLQILLASGEDIDNWPEEAAQVRGPIRDFLSAALDIYFKKNNIQTGSEADWND